MAARRRRLPAPLNPYVVLADVAINLMLIVCLLFVVSARVRDAYFESKHDAFAALAERHISLWRAKRQLKRSGQNLELRFGTESWFPPDGDQLSSAGQRLAVDLADLIADPLFRGDSARGHLFGQIHVTVTQGPKADPSRIYRRAQAVRAALESPLRRANHRWRIVASGRIQALGDAGDSHRNDVDVVITLRSPVSGT